MKITLLSGLSFLLESVVVFNLSLLKNHSFHIGRLNFVFCLFLNR